MTKQKKMMTQTVMIPAIVQIQIFMINHNLEIFKNSQETLKILIIVFKKEKLNQVITLT